MPEGAAEYHEHMFFYRAPRRPGQGASFAGRGNFDALAAHAVVCAKERHPGIRLTMLLPYHPAERPVSLPKGFDDTFYPPGMERVPRRVAIVRANQYMVEHSTYLIAYVSHPSSGSREVLEDALRRQRRGLIHVINLAGWYPI